MIQTKCPKCGNWIPKSWIRKDVFPHIICTKKGGHIKLPKTKEVCQKCGKPFDINEKYISKEENFYDICGKEIEENKR